MSGIELIIIAGFGVVSSLASSFYHVYKLKRIHATNKDILKNVLSQIQPITNEPTNEPIAETTAYDKVDTPTVEDLKEMKTYYNPKTKQIEHYYESPATSRNGVIVPKLNVKGI